MIPQLFHFVPQPLIQPFLCIVGKVRKYAQAGGAEVVVFSVIVDDLAAISANKFALMLCSPLALNERTFRSAEQLIAQKICQKLLRSRIGG